MRCLAFADTHNDQDAIKSLVLRAKKEDIDIVLCAGDLSNFGRGLKTSLRLLDGINKPVYIVPGNHEGDEEINTALNGFKNIINLHKKAIEKDNFLLLGYGDGGFAQEDKEFRKIARSWYGQYKERKVIFMTHGPAFGTKLDFLDDHGHVGNKDYTKFIRRIKPKLVVSGHIHETAGTIQTIEGVKLINPGWDGLIITLK